MTDFLCIDGSQGEGGGQILRSSLSLSMLTGTPIQIEQIRAGRSKPGLMRQHLVCVQAARQTSAAVVHGDELGSTALQFTPNLISGGFHHFKIGSAGSTSLVLQTILPALLVAEQKSQITLSGGTHNSSAPSSDFLARVFVPQLRAMGADISIDTLQLGLFPAGNGTVVVNVQPRQYHGRALKPLQLLERGAQKAISAHAILASVPLKVATRELELAAKAFKIRPEHLAVRDAGRLTGPGNVFELWAEFDHVSELITSHGAKGLTAESVAQAACDQLDAYLKQGSVVGEHLADQLLLPLWLAGGGEFVTASISAHLQTNIDVINQFPGPKFAVRELKTGFWVGVV